MTTHIFLSHVKVLELFQDICGTSDYSPDSVFSQAQCSSAHCAAAPRQPLPQSDHTAPFAHALSVRQREFTELVSMINF